MPDPLFTVIVPVGDGGAAFDRCLDALASSRSREFELIVVDDGSGEGCVAAAARSGAAVLRTRGRQGPAAARNLGAGRARGDFLFFLDADCEIHPDTLTAAAEVLAADPTIDALFGSYDDAPAAPGFVAQYKNLFHHYVHQRADPEATTFWAGCGAVRRSAFLAVGGFDEEQFRRPSIEDIELGYRLRQAGFRIRLAKTVRVKHLKAWTFEDLLKSDILDRGMPWTELMLVRGRLDDVLNVGRRDRIGVVATGLLVLCLAAAAWFPVLLVPAGLLAFGLLAMHRDLYRFFARRRGIGFAARAIPLHWLYHLCSGLAFILGAWRYLRTSPRRSRAREAGLP